MDYFLLVKRAKNNAGRKLPTERNNIKNSKGRNENTGCGNELVLRVPQHHNGILPCWIFLLQRIRDSAGKCKMGFCPRIDRSVKPAIDKTHKKESRLMRDAQKIAKKLAHLV